MMNKLEKRFVQKFYARVGACIHAHDMLQDGDKVCVGLSGGKDSLALLQTLAGRRKFSETKYDLIAVHIDVQEVPYKVDNQWLQQFCDELEVPLIIEKVSVDFNKTAKDSTCFYCSWNRRKRLFEMTKQLDVNKLALGHHRDDALETMMLNMISHGTLSAMPGKLPMFEGRIQLIRPMLDLTSDDTQRFADIHQFPTERKKCPYENSTRRFEVRDLLNDIQAKFPEAKINMYKSLSNIYLDYMPAADKEAAVIRDARCIPSDDS
jgi:tRNA(Ile)-lysidine synthetase-like protein